MFDWNTFEILKNKMKICDVSEVQWGVGDLIRGCSPNDRNRLTYDKLLEPRPRPDKVRDKTRDIFRFIL